MNDAKHTPGPWKVDDNNEGSFYVRMGSAIESRWRHRPHHVIAICEELAHGRQLDEAIANARLIAAAPQLLVALEALLAEVQFCGGWDDDDPIVAAARAAIAAAKGEG